MTLAKKLEKKLGRTFFGLLLWFLILFSYFIFVFNWLLMNQTEGSVANDNGWAGAFFTTTPSTLTTQAVNYTITFMRMIGALASGFVIAKLGHKKSILIAMALLSVAFPTIFAGYWHSKGGYAVFIIGRMFMAIGGTTLLVYIQPVIARFFSPKGKTVLTRLNTTGYNVGSAMPLILFAIPTVKASMIENWLVWGIVTALIPLILLIIYWIMAPDIEIKKPAQGFEQNKNLRPATWKDVALEKDTWIVSIMGGLWTIGVVAIIVLTPDSFAQLHEKRFTKLEPWQEVLPIILFLLSFFVGNYAIGWILKTNFDRRYYLTGCYFSGFGAIIGAYLCTAYVASIVPTCILMFLAGMILYGSQPVQFTHAHEVKHNSPQRTGIVVAFYVGIGYGVSTIANIILPIIYDSFDVINNPNNLELAAWLQFGIAMFFSLSAAALTPFIKKTHDQKLSKFLWKKLRIKKLA